MRHLSHSQPQSAKLQTHCLKMTDFRRFLPNGSALWRLHRLQSQPHRLQTGEMASLGGSGGPGWGARGRRRGPAGLRGDAPHVNTPGTTGVEGAGGPGGPGCGTRGQWSRHIPEISHVISLGQFLISPTNVAIPTTPIQCLKGLHGNYVRNCWAHNSRAGQTAAPRSDGRDTYLKFRMQFECMNFQQSSETLQFQRCQFKSSNSHGGIACEIAGRTPGATGMESGPGARPQATTTRKPRPPPQPRAARAGTGRGSG